MNVSIFSLVFSRNSRFSTHFVVFFPETQRLLIPAYRRMPDSSPGTNTIHIITVSKSFAHIGEFKILKIKKMEDSSSPEPTQSTSLRKRKSRKNEEEEEELMKSPSKCVRTLLQKAIKTTTTVAGGSKAYRGYVEEASNIASDHGRMVIRTAMLCFKSSKSRPSKSILEAYIKGSNLVRKASKDMAPEEIALRLNALKHELSMRSIRSKKLKNR